MTCTEYLYFFVFSQTRKRKPKGSKGSSNTDGATPNRSKNATTNNNNCTTNNNNNNTVIQDSVNGKQRFSFLLVLFVIFSLFIDSKFEY